MHLHGAGEERDYELAFPAGYLRTNVSTRFRSRVSAAFIQEAGWSISDRRPKRFRKKPRVSSYMLTVNMQLLAHPQFREFHILESCFQRTMKLQG